MTKVKNKNPKSSHLARRSSTLHAPRTQVYRHPINPTKKLILAVILLNMAIIITATACSFLLTTENQVKSTISHLASDYYENYFYQNLINSPKYQNLEDKNSAMERYHSYGLDIVTLNDLLLYDNQKNAEYSDYLTKYCDVNATHAKIYADPPYDQKSYHIDYTYSCDF